MVASKRPAGQVPKAAAKKNKGENNQENGGNGEENKPLALEDAAPVEEKEETEGKEEKGNQETKKAKPKAMKKTKATPKQKAKAKPKAGTKKAGTKKAVPPVKKSGLKKSDKEKALKKPKQEEDKGAKAKGNKQTMKEKTAAWRQPLGIKKKEVEEGEEEGQKEAGPEVSPDETRNYAKARKFAKMLKKGQLPEEIKLMYMQAAQNSESPRLFRTEMINRLFQKNKKNEWVMVSTSPEFQSWKQSNDTRFATAKSVGTAGMVMLWSIFHGNKGAMEEAARVGDIFEHEGLWYSKRVETGRTKELKDAMQLSGGKAQLSVDEYSDMSSWLQDRPWSKYGEQLPELGNSSACSCQ